MEEDTSSVRLKQTTQTFIKRHTNVVSGWLLRMLCLSLTVEGAEKDSEEAPGVPLLVGLGSAQVDQVLLNGVTGERLHLRPAVAIADRHHKHRHALALGLQGDVLQLGPVGISGLGADHGEQHPLPPGSGGLREHLVQGELQRLSQSRGAALLLHVPDQVRPHGAAVLVGQQTELHLGRLGDALLDRGHPGLFAGSAGLRAHGQLLHHGAQQLLDAGVLVRLHLPGAVQQHDQVHVRLLGRQRLLDRGALRCTPARV